MEEQPALHIIGILRGDIKSREDAPKNYDESEKTGTLEIFPEYQDGLEIQKNRCEGEKDYEDHWN
jgi:tRNA (adenine37-N6)-methyltransferase